jgi:hypothetical protein
MLQRTAFGVLRSCSQVHAGACTRCCGGGGGAQQQPWGRSGLVAVMFADATNSSAPE